MIVGLGNPGREYRDTRHNVGFMIADRLAAALGVSFRQEKAWRAELAKAPGVFVCKPQAYMNLSGEAVRAIADFYKIRPEEVLVVLDDMALPLGKLRLREGGSAGGHNGLKSVIEHLGTTAVPRLRVGIGAALSGQASDHVLGRFTMDEEPLLKESLERAMAAIDCAQSQGLVGAMNIYN